jgi:uncharacterized membrane protein
MWRRTRFSILHLLFGMSVVALFVASLLNQSPWYRATLGTLTSGMILNAILASLFTTGERRALALSYFIGAIFFGAGMYTYVVSLPYLLTVEFLPWLSSFSSVPIDEENYLIVAAIFWLQVTCMASAIIGRAWYRNSFSPGKNVAVLPTVEADATAA